MEKTNNTTKLRQHTYVQQLNLTILDNKLYIKRDDLFPYSFGGNKARKAFLFFEDIRRKRADYVVTYGSHSSNHCRVIANLSVRNNLPCLIISPNISTNASFNSTLVNLFNASIKKCELDTVSETIEKELTTLKLKGYNPYFIEGGGHGNIGTQAYVNVFEEIINYEKEKKIKFDYIFHATGTGTTQAGLICGNIINESSTDVVGISIARKEKYGKEVVLNSVNSYLESIGRLSVKKNEINFIDEYVLDGYGSFNDEIINTVKSFLIREGIPLDLIYTGKAFWGMEEYIKEKKITNKNILFIHTGGTPIFFDNLRQVLNG